MMKKFLVLLTVLSALHVGYVSAMQKRFLVTPPTSPTRHQLISGIGVPLALEDESITLGIVFKAYYTLVRIVDEINL